MSTSNFSGPVNSGSGFQLNGSPAGFVGTFFKSGLYYSADPTQAVGAYTPPNGETRAAAFWVDAGRGFDRISINCTVVGTDVGAVTRLGIYRDNGNLFPDTLLLDAGTVATGSGSGTGVKEITIGLFLPPGWYWLLAVNQGVAGTAPTLAGMSSVSLPALGMASLGNSVNSGIWLTGITGALPATIPTAIYAALPMPQVFLRAM